MNYLNEYAKASANPESYWLEQAELISWHTKPNVGFYPEKGWFPDGKLNTCYLALDKHVEEGRGSNVALFYDSPVTNTKAQFTFDELLDVVSKFASVLQSNGINKGDRVVIYLPMIPQAVIAMLACARIGAVHSVVFGGFAAKELATRIDDAQPKMILTASCGIEINKIIEYKPIVDQAIDLAEHKVEKCVVFQRPQVEAALNPNIDIDWQEAVSGAKGTDCVIVDSDAPLYILYTSGTTGKPKGVLRDHGSHAVAMAYSMKNVYGVEKGDVFFSGSDVGWVVGHSYIVYGPLITGCSTVLYEGKPVKTPNPGAFWRICDDYKVNVLFSAPTAFRAMRKEDPKCEDFNQYDLTSLKRIYLAGERLDPSTFDWLATYTNKPIIDHWWQTETGWAIAATPKGIEDLETKAGAAGVPMPGYQVDILDDEGQILPAGQTGNVAIKMPLPPGCLRTLWNNYVGFQSSYLSNFPGYYTSGDGGYIDEDGYLHIMGRTDDVVNVAGHRLSTGEMEQSIAGHSAVAECAVVGLPCPLKGQVPLAFVVCQNGADIALDLESELKSKVRDNIGAIASLKDVIVVEKLPKTRSGKILRKLIRQMASGEDILVPSTIEDPTVVDNLKLVLKHQL